MHSSLNNLGGPLLLASCQNFPTDLKSSDERISAEEVFDFLKMFDRDAIYMGKVALVIFQPDKRGWQVFQPSYLVFTAIESM